MFILNINYIKPISEVEQFLDSHILFSEKYYKSNKFICSSRKNPRNGGIILCNAENTTEVNKIISEDPFFIKKIASYEIIEFIPSKYSEKFNEFI